jgi:hypothetical protein
MWRSKLGKQYPKDLIIRLDREHYNTLRKLRADPDNSRCADCGKADDTWASVNLGIFLCVRCADVHRALGTHISKVKACTGTDLWGPDEIARMQEVGNAKAGQLYGGFVYSSMPPSSKVELMRLTLRKYELQACPTEENNQHSLQHAVGKQVDLTWKSDDARCKISSGTRKIDGYGHGPRSNVFTRSEINFSDFQWVESESESQVECISARSTSCSTASEASQAPPKRANCWYGSTRAKEISVNDDFHFDEVFAGADDGTNATMCNLTTPSIVRSKTNADTHSVDLGIASNGDDLPGFSCVNVSAGEYARENLKLQSPMFPSVSQTNVQTGSVQVEPSNKDDDLWAGFEDW